MFHRLAGKVSKLRSPTPFRTTAGDEPVLGQECAHRYVTKVNQYEEIELSQILEESARLGVPADAKLMELAHQRLYNIAIRIIGHHQDTPTLGPTALINEGFQRMFTSGQFSGIESVSHFYARFTLCMRHALVDYSRKKASHRRTRYARRSRESIERGESRKLPRVGNKPVVDPALSLVDIADILEVMAKESASSARAAKLFQMKYFGSMTVDEVKSVTGYSQSVIELDLRYARARVAQQLLPT